MGINVKVTVDTREVTDELHRLMLAPDIKLVLEFNAIFAVATAATWAMIHVETGSLKSTVKWTSPGYPEGWQGTLTVGGAAPGWPRDPAYYGVYELARGRTHFFFAPAYANIPSQVINAILGFYANSKIKILTVADPSLIGTTKTTIKTGAKGKKKTTSRKTKKKGGA
jgi:hypothetical protein